MSEGTWEVRIAETQTGEGNLYHIEIAHNTVLQRLGNDLTVRHSGWKPADAHCYVRKQNAIYQARKLLERLNAPARYHEVTTDD